MNMQTVDRKGFSMMELMIVVVVIGILAAVAVPNMSAWFSKKDLDSTTRTLFSHFQQARSQAVKGNENVRICFDLGASPNRYIVKADRSGVIVNWTSLPSNRISFDSPTFAGLLSGANSTGFNNRGLALQQGTITIVSSDAPSANNRRVITLTIGGGTSITP